MPKKEDPQSYGSEGLLLPASTKRGEQHDPLHGQEDGHFLTVEWIVLFSFGGPLPAKSELFTVSRPIVLVPFL